MNKFLSKEGGGYLGSVRLMLGLAATQRQLSHICVSKRFKMQRLLERTNMLTKNIGLVKANFTSIQVSPLRKGTCTRHEKTSVGDQVNSL